MKWIKMSEQLPNEKALILLFNKVHEEQHIGWFDGKTFIWGEYDSAELSDGDISYWMPLPEDPPRD